MYHSLNPGETGAFGGIGQTNPIMDVTQGSSCRSQ